MTLNLIILGAGGIGCYYGTRLFDGGHGITFIARGAHLRAVKQNGLTMRHSAFNFSDRVNACDMGALTRNYQPKDFDAIVVCVKSTVTEGVAADIKDWFERCRQDTAVISLQNGIDNERQLAEALGEDNIIGGLAVRIGGHIVEPGVVEATGAAQVILGPWPYSGSPADRKYSRRMGRLVEAFNEAGIPTRQVGDIRRELWRKLVINNGVNPLSALTRLDTRTLTHHEEFSSLVYEIMRETATAARADGEELTDKDVEEMFGLIRAFDPIKTSMLVDLEKGRPLELEAISGVILQRSETLGVAAPYTRTVYALLKQAMRDGQHGYRRTSRG